MIMLLDVVPSCPRLFS